MKKVFIGIDPSVTGTAIFIKTDGVVKALALTDKLRASEEGQDTKYLTIVKLPKKESKLYDIQTKRYMKHNKVIFQLLDEIIEPEDEVQVCIEGYAMRGKGKVFELAEVSAMLKMSVLERGWNLKIISPSEVKQTLVESGWAEKWMIWDVIHSKNGYITAPNRIGTKEKIYRCSLDRTDILTVLGDMQVVGLKGDNFKNDIVDAWGLCEIAQRV